MPRSFDSLQPIPSSVREKHWIVPSAFSTNWCSSKTRGFVGYVTPPRIVHVAPSSVETNIRELGSQNHLHTGITHSPVESRIDLPMATPSAIFRRGVQFIVSDSGSSPYMTTT